MNRTLLVLLALLSSSADVAVAATSTATEPTLVTVRAVARGAKLLGSNVGGARITVTDVETGERLAAGFQEGTTGETMRIMEASPVGDGPVYDTPGAAKFEAALAISEPRRVEIVAEGPLGSPHALARASRTLLVVPGEHVVGEGVVLELQGYRMAIEEPANDAVAAVGSELRVHATVTMLCGCPLRPGGLWDSDRVRIVARLRPHGEGDVVETPLRFAGVDSTFEGELTVAVPGPFTLEVVATDPSSGNGGVVAVRGEATPAHAEPGAPDGERVTLELADGVPIELVRVEPGSFVMGSRLSPERLTELFGDVAGDPDANRVDAVRRRVELRTGFWIGIHEVTNRQFAAFVEATGYRTDGERAGAGFVLVDGRWRRVEGVTWRDYGRVPAADAPVVMVTWEDARRFAAWLSTRSADPALSCRLPTEAEWEYAARAGTDTEFVFGDEPTDLQEWGWCGLDESGVDGPQPVGRKRPNAWGLHDVHGNVFEWVEDWYGPFEEETVIDPRGSRSGEVKGVRGGSWAKDVGSCRSNHRAADRPALAESHIGFRVLCELAQPDAPADDLLIDHVTVHSMLDETIAADHAVLVRGAEIVWIGPSAEATHLRPATRIDGGGAHLVPGLVDMHVHLVDERDLDLYLLHGVTTIVNLGSRLDAVGLRERIRAGAIEGPDILTSGRILDREPGPSYFVAVGTSPDVARAEVERQVANGVDLIKLYDGLDGPTLGAAVAAAHVAGRPVFGHAPRSIDFAETLERLDVVAHGEEFFYTFFENRDDGSRLAEAARLAAGRGVAVIPNTGFIRTILDQAEDIDGFLSRDEVRYVSPSTLANWMPEINRYVGRGPEWLARNRRMHPFLHRLTAALRNASVPLFAGSDAGAIGGIPGVSLHQEIAELRLSGLAPFEALAAATRVPGDWLAEHVAGAAPRGAIEVGRRADLLLVDGDPVADPAALERLRAVVAGGRLRWTDDLRDQLAPLVAENERRLAWHAEVRARLAGDDLEALEALLDDAPSPEFAERVVNGLGYAALGRHGDADRAVALFELNARRFPESWNAWDSLGEGLAERGDPTEAIAAYARSLELNPENSNARERIARLSAP